MQGKSKSPGAAAETVETRLAAFLRAHARRPDAIRADTRFSARLALERAFVAAPTD
jgi:hypothetical protein